MRLILPTGPDGADRAYPLDDIVTDAGGGLSLNLAIDLRRHTGLGLQAFYEGLRAAEIVAGDGADPAVVLLAMSDRLELMEAYRALIWLARHSAGDRASDGSVLTVEAAAALPFQRIRAAMDPGDEVPAAETPDPPRPPTGSGRGTGGGSSKASPGRSRKTSGRKS